MKLTLARHGETDLNIEDRYQGISDLPLNAQGLEQAALLAQRLPADIDFIVASPQQRALQTAKAVGEQRGLPVRTMGAFRERNFGEFDGLTPAEVQTRYPQLWARNILQQWDEAPPGGETTHEVVQRVDTGLRHLKTQHGHHHVLLVVHGFVVRAARYRFSGIAQTEFFVEPKLDNCGFISFPWADAPF